MGDKSITKCDKEAMLGYWFMLTGIITDLNEAYEKADILQSSLENIEGIFKECSYAFQEGAISEMSGNLVTLLGYVGKAQACVWKELDHPLYVDFKNNATETLSVSF